MKDHLEGHKSSDIKKQEIVQEKQQETGVKQIGQLIPGDGHSLYEMDEATLIVRKMEHFKLTDTINYVAAAAGVETNQKKAFMTRINCMYVCKLNMKNAIKFFTKHYGEGVRAVTPDDPDPHTDDNE